MRSVNSRSPHFVLGAVTFSASSASASPFWDWLFTHDEPPAYYSPARYLAPTAARVNDHIHGPRISVYAPDRHPEIPPTVITIPSSTPAQQPSESLVPAPVAPVTSRAR